MILLQPYVVEFFSKWDTATTYLEKEQIKHDIVWKLLDTNQITIDQEKGGVFAERNNKFVSIGSENNNRPCLKFYKSKIVILIDRVVWYSLHKNEIIPEDKVIVHLDNNVKNNSINNLQLGEYKDYFVCTTREAELAFIQAIKDGKYTIDIEKGTLFNNTTNNYIGRVGTNGTIEVGIRYKGRTRPVLLHRLVWSIANDRIIPDSYIINHIDGNKQNNNYKNLELATNKGNVKHATINNLRKVANKDSNKLTYEQAETIRKLHKSKYMNTTELSKMFGVPSSVIKNVIENRTYRYDIDEHNKTLEELRNNRTSDISLTSFTENANPQLQYNSNNKLTYNQAETIRSLYRNNNKEYTFRSLAEMFNVSPDTISRIINNESYKYDPNLLNTVVNTNNDVVSTTNNRYRKKELITDVYTSRWKDATTYEEKEQIKYEIVQILIKENFVRINYDKGIVYDTETNEIYGSINPGHGYVSVYCKHSITIPNAKIIWYSVHHELIPKNYILSHKNGNRFDDRVDNLEVIPMREVARRGNISSNSRFIGMQEKKVKIDYICKEGEFEQYILDAVKSGKYKVDVEKGIFYGIKGEPVGCNHNNCVRVGIYYKFKMRYISLGKVIWMVANNKILPENGMIIYKDGNIENTSIHNLELSPNTRPIEFDVSTVRPYGSMLTYEDARIIRELYARDPRYYTQVRLAEMFSCAQPSISEILRNRKLSVN